MKSQIDLQMLSVRSLLNPQDFISAVELQCQMLPEYMPQKFGWYEPLKLPFDPNHLEQLIPPDRGGSADSVWWKRTGKQRAEGSWMKRWKSGVDYLKDTHSTTAISLYETKFEDKLLAYLKAGSLLGQVDFSFLDGLTDKYKPFAEANGLNQWQLFGTTTHKLRHWLPDMLWATVLGPAYVRMFGKDRVLSSPACLVEEIGYETVYIQLTPKLQDIYDKFDDVMVMRERVKRHLGMDAFYQPELAYDQKEHPERAGKVFRTPDFQLLPD